MKELTTQEKADRFDEAIERLRNAFYDNSGRMCEEYRKAVIRIIEPIFPELKESEDEIVRKWIIDYLNNRILNSSILDEKESCKKALAWLERQDNKLVPKFSIGQRIRNRNGEMHAFVIDRIEDDSYKGKNGESISMAFQDDWELYKPVRENTSEWCEEVTRNEDDVFPNLIQPDRVATPAEEYSFNIGSELFQQLTTKEQQGLWKKEIEQAYNAGAEASAEWSEEDKDYYDAIIAKLEVTQEDAALTDNQMNFLKSLKERAQHQ